MKQYSDKQTNRFQPAGINYNQVGINNQAQGQAIGASQQLNASLQNFFGEVGNIAFEFGKQNAEIQGQEEAQTNTEEWLKHIKKKNNHRAFEYRNRRRERIKTYTRSLSIT